MDDEADEAPAPPTQDEKRRLTVAVMAGSIAPRDAGWLLEWKEAWKQLAVLPSHQRVTVYGALTFTIAFGGFLVWAVLSGHDAVTAFALLGFLGVSVVTLPAALVATTIAGRKRRTSRRH